MIGKTKNTLLHVTAITLIILVVVVAFVATNWVEQASRVSLEKSLHVALNSARQGVRLLYRTHQAPALVWANDDHVLTVVRQLLQVPPTRKDLIAAPAQGQLRALFTPFLNVSGIDGYFIIDQNGRSISSTRDENIGTPNLLTEQIGYLDQVWQGRTFTSLPLKSDVPLNDEHGQLVNGHSTMFSSTPIQDETGQTIAILALRISPDDSFEPIFDRARFGESGETYAINAEGIMLNDSRFSDQLVDVGLQGDLHHEDLMLAIRDPGVNLIQGEQPKLAREAQPLTRMAMALTQGQSGMDLTGYRDYRGVPVAGAWVWDETLGFGIATEINLSEANIELNQVKAGILVGTILLMLTLGATWTLSVVIRREVSQGANRATLDKNTAERSKAEADKANQAKSEFLSSMSHELRTPLNSILGFGQMLDFNPKEPLSKSQKECVDHITKGGQHLLNLINDILDLAKIESGKVALSLEDVSPAVIINECLLLINPMAKKNSIEVSVLDGVLEAPNVLADHTRFKQVLLNLISNAIKYNRENGTILISFEETSGNMLRIAVADTGAGIAIDKQSELFKPFSRLGAENTEIEGTGIGLVVCKELVTLMNGTVGLESTIGKGSKFWIELPLSESLSHPPMTTVETALLSAQSTLPVIDGTLCQHFLSEPGQLPTW